MNPWDYLAGLLIAREAGAYAVDFRGEVLETSAMVFRRPVIAGTRALLESIIAEGAI